MIAGAQPHRVVVDIGHADFTVKSRLIDLGNRQTLSIPALIFAIVAVVDPLPPGGACCSI